MMTDFHPSVSVIIPSHNRKDLLREILDNLARQTFPAGQFEVIIVLDGCNDGSADMLRAYSSPFYLQMIEQDSQGPSAARNQGARQAHNEFLIFLDDDIVPVPDFIQSHVNAHRSPTPTVVIGYCPPALAGQKSFFKLELQSWWETMYQVMKQPGYRFRFTDMLSGNFSISREIFLNLGGFNLEYFVHEDYEFGVRLIREGVALVFEQQALGLHFEKSDLKRALLRKFQEGIADIQLGRTYPELIPNLLIWRLDKYTLLPSQIMRILRFKLPRLGDWIASSAMLSLPFFSRMRMLGIWRKILYGLLGYWYWKGVSQELTTLKQVRDFITIDSEESFAQYHDYIDLDISQGFEQAEQILDDTRPQTVRIFDGEHFICCIPPEAGAERLLAAHLRPFLILHLATKFQGKHPESILQPPVSISRLVRCE